MFSLNNQDIYQLVFILFKWNMINILSLITIPYLSESYFYFTLGGM